MIRLPVDERRDGGPKPAVRWAKDDLLEAHREADVPPPPEEVVEVLVGVACCRISRTHLAQKIQTVRFRERAFRLNIEQIVDTESQLRICCLGCNARTRRRCCSRSVG